MIFNYYVHTKESSGNPKANTLEHQRPQHGRPTACVIAQQHSSGTFVSLSFHARQEKFGRRLKNI
jgi:hypothetical protein